MEQQTNSPLDENGYPIYGTFQDRKRLTAVEWLEEQLNKWLDGRLYLPPHLFEQAKQMEKKQHRHTWMYEGDIDNASYERFERYYQITFGGQGSPDTTTSPTK